MSLLDRVQLVFLRPRNPENLGAIARVMKNFELTRWSLVDPGTHDFGAARRVAVQSEELLDTPTLPSTLEEAVATASFVVGTSSRRPTGVPKREPRAFAEEALKRAARGEEIALVFGDERSGMNNEELSRCHALVRIPSGEAQPSLNLAQSVAVLAYELRLAARAVTVVSETGQASVSDAQLTQLEDFVRRALGQGGFLAPGGPRHAPRDLMRPLQRAQLSQREWRLWMAALGKLAQSPGLLGSAAQKTIDCPAAARSTGRAHRKTPTGR